MLDRMGVRGGGGLRIGYGTLVGGPTISARINVSWAWIAICVLVIPIGPGKSFAGRMVSAAMLPGYPVSARMPLAYP